MTRLDESERESILARVKAIVGEHARPNAARYDDTAQFPTDNFEAIGRAGLMGLYVPKQYGGLGGDHTLYTRVIRELAQACPSTAMLSVMHHSQYSTLVFHGSERQKEFFLPPIARGESFIANGATEGLTGDSFYAPGTVPHSRLAAVDDGFHLNASKSIVSGASYARWVFLVCRLESDSTGGKRAVLAPGAGQPGVFPFGEWNPIGMRATASTGLEYRDCFIPSWHAFEAIGPLARTGVPVVLLGFCSVWLGIATAAYELAVGHVTGRSIEVLQTERREGGDAGQVRVRSTISRFESVQRQVSEMKTRLDAATALVDNLARRIEEGQPDPGSPVTPEAFETLADLCSSCRIFTSETAIDVARVAMRVCGARGLQRGVALERFMRDALTAQVMGATEDASKVWHGKRLLGVPAV